MPPNNCFSKARPTEVEFTAKINLLGGSIEISCVPSPSYRLAQADDPQVHKCRKWDIN